MRSLFIWLEPPKRVIPFIRWAAIAGAGLPVEANISPGSFVAARSIQSGPVALGQNTWVSTFEPVVYMSRETQNSMESLQKQSAGHYCYGVAEAMGWT